MERCELEIDQLKLGEPFIDIGDPFMRMKLATFVRLHGQINDIIIDRLWNVVQGHEIVNAMVSAGYKTIWCRVILYDKPAELVAAKLLLTAAQIKLNYINIAKAISEVCKTQNDFNTLANGSPISTVDIRRYRDILTFDWEAFSKEPIGLGYDLFGNEIKAK